MGTTNEPSGSGLFEESTLALDEARREDELRARLALALTQKFQPAHAVNLIRVFGSMLSALGADKAKLRALRGVNAEKVKLWRDCYHSEAVDLEIARARAFGVSFLMLGEELYPQLLTRISDPPHTLWVRGEILLEDHLAIAVVGARNADQYGTHVASTLAGQIVQRSITVISGLARGIDTAAHKGALDGRGRTLAVIGSGLKRMYPPENERLAAAIAGAGALVSEYPMDTPARARNFPQRNRIISGLSLGVVVAQAGTKSGSLITARLAAEEGREVFAVPGRIDSRYSKGCHELLRSGAKLVDSVESIFEELPALSGLPCAGAQEDSCQSLERSVPLGATPTESDIIRVLARQDQVNIEELAAETGLAMPQLSSALLTLEMRGAISTRPGKNYTLA